MDRVWHWPMCMGSMVPFGKVAFEFHCNTTRSNTSNEVLRWRWQRPWNRRTKLAELTSNWVLVNRVAHFHLGSHQLMIEQTNWNNWLLFQWVNYNIILLKSQVRTSSFVKIHQINFFYMKYRLVKTAFLFKCFPRRPLLNTNQTKISKSIGGQNN